MPRALAIETSGRVGSLALVENSTILAEQTFQHGLQNAAQMLPIIDGLCREHEWKPADIEHLYVSAGPGSFTGLRLGITLCKTLAMVTGAKIVAVPTLRVLVENTPSDASEVIIVLDAKREQIFTARFVRAENDEWEEVEPPHLDSLAAVISRTVGRVHLLGEGIPYHRQFIPDHSRVIVTGEDLWRARASSAAKIGERMAQRGEFTDPFKLTPIYIRKPEAEEKWEANVARAPRT
jgi:tRNA threonylcarbamoyladenosine biosynthesis protein TsaB